MRSKSELASRGGAKVPRGIYKLAALNTLCFVSFAIITPVLDVLVREPFSTDNSGTAKFMAIHGVASLMFYLFGGLLSDRMGRRVPLIVIGLIGSGITTTLIPIMNSFAALLMVRFVDGLFGALSLGLLITRSLDIAGPENRNRAMGIMSISIAAGFIIANMLTGLLGHQGRGGLLILFGLVGGLLIAGGIWMIVDLRENETIVPMARGFRKLIGGLRSQPQLIVPVMFAWTDKFTFGTLAHLTALAVVDMFGEELQGLGWGGREPLFASLILLGFWVTFSVTAVPGSRLCDRFGTVPTLIAGSAMYGVAILMLGQVPLAGFAIAMAVAGIFCAIQYVPSIALVGEISAPDQRGLNMGIWNTAGSLGVVMGLILSGKLSMQSYALAYGVAGGLEIGCAFVGLVYWTVTKRQR